MASLSLVLNKIRNTFQILDLGPLEMLYGHSFVTNDFLFHRQIDALLKDITSLTKF